MSIEEIRNRHDEDQKYDHDSPREEQMHQDRAYLLDAYSQVKFQEVIARQRIEELEDAMRLIDPFLDQLVCYASTTTEHKPNAHLRIFRAAIKGEGDDPHGIKANHRKLKATLDREIEQEIKGDGDGTV